MISEINNCDPAQILYGNPQHETAPLTDPERLGVVVVVVPSERVLYTYLRNPDGDGTHVEVDAHRVEELVV